MDKYNKNILLQLNERLLNGMIESEELYLNEITIKSDEFYDYKDINYQNSITYSFYDRCNNNLYAAFNPRNGEFKSGFKIQSRDKLIFDFKEAAKYEDEIKPCADDLKISTIYRILSHEIIPNHIIKQGAHKLWLNPISISRQRITDMILNQLEEDFPELNRRGNNLTYVNF